MRKTMKSAKSLGEYLTKEYVARSERNPRYSHRAFARDTGLSVSHLSEVLRGRNGLSRAATEKVASVLQLSQTELDYLWNLIQRDFSKSAAVRTRASSKLPVILKESETLLLDPRKFQKKLNWQHLAVFEMARAGLLKMTELKTAAARLGISSRALKELIESLVEMDFLRHEDGLFTVRRQQIFFEGFPNTALRQVHKDMLAKAIESVEKQTFQTRYLSTNFNAIRADQYPAAVERIQAFVSAFNTEFGTTDVTETVYVLSLQLFDLLKQKET